MADRYELHLGKSEEVLRQYPDNHFDSVVTDPPYHLTSIVKRFGKEGSAPAQFGTDGAYARASRGFMGQEWDGGDIAFQPAFWAEVIRVLKPGGHMVAFSGCRTYHRMACAIEDAGFEIRDQIMWIYGSGFPKSHDVSKGIDKALGAERPVTGLQKRSGIPTAAENYQGNEKWSGLRRDKPATEAAQEWEGWASALKPAHEPICLARKPLIGSIAQNVLAHGTGALNIDGCRIQSEEVPEGRSRHGGGNMQGASFQMPDSESFMPAGRWPANIIHDGSDEVVNAFPESEGGAFPQKVSNSDRINFRTAECRPERIELQDSGSAARFFYCAKASKQDRDEGVHTGNGHPTVKPTDLMRYLCRLITPPGGIVLDPFMGSGSTGKAAILEQFRFVGIDMTPEYIDIASQRIAYAACEPSGSVDTAKLENAPSETQFDLFT